LEAEEGCIEWRGALFVEKLQFILCEILGAMVEEDDLWLLILVKEVVARGQGERELGDWIPFCVWLAFYVVK
jgi:hypothetical protein